MQALWNWFSSRRALISNGREFYQAGARANVLPYEIRALRELNQFCRACKTELFHQAYG